MGERNIKPLTLAIKQQRKIQTVPHEKFKPIICMCIHTLSSSLWLLVIRKNYFADFGRFMFSKRPLSFFSVWNWCKQENPLSKLADKGKLKLTTKLNLNIVKRCISSTDILTSNYYPSSLQQRRKEQPQEKSLTLTILLFSATDFRECPVMLKTRGMRFLVPPDRTEHPRGNEHTHRSPSDSGYLVPTDWESFVRVQQRNTLSLRVQLLACPSSSRCLQVKSRGRTWGRAGERDRKEQDPIQSYTSTGKMHVKPHSYIYPCQWRHRDHT